MSKTKSDDFLDNASIETLLKSAPRDTKFKAIKEKIIKEQENQLIDEDAKRKSEEWSDLANQVVGSETL